MCHGVWPSCHDLGLVSMSVSSVPRIHQVPSNRLSVCVSVCVRTRVFICVCVRVFMCVCPCVHVEALGQAWVVFFRILSTLCFETFSPTELGICLIKLGWQSSEPHGFFCLCLPSTGLTSGPHPTWFFIRMLGVKPRITCLCGNTFPTELSR